MGLVSFALCLRRVAPPKNAACEGFLGRLKTKCSMVALGQEVRLMNFSRKIDRYINWYNHKRIKLALGGLSPIKYRYHLGFAA